jgi:folate-binding Fe-S cluster repair protein YgfZ
VGQETLAKLATYDGVKQQLRRWCWQQRDANPADAEIPTVGQTLWSPSGNKAGTITSVLRLPQRDGALWIGLALVRRSALGLEQLLAGEAEAADPRPLLTVSVPEAFVPPPPPAAGSQAGKSQS